MRRKLLLAAAAAAVLLAGCGGDPAPAPPDHNGTDVMYLQMMLAHHEPSADLLALGRTRATRPDVRAMAAEFESARVAETTMMTGWLEEWGQPLTADADPAVHAGHGAGPSSDGASDIGRTRMRRRLLLAAAGAALLLAGCGADPAPAAPDHNGTDVMYLQMMLAHHEPSADLLALGRTRATRPDVRAMATEFETARAAETTMMTGWLEEWGQPLAADADPAVHAGHGAGLHALGATEIAELAAMSPEEFDLAFVNVLIGHQHGAVELARMETAGGANPEVKELARRTDEAVRAQIQQMLRMVA